MNDKERRPDPNDHHDDHHDHKKKKKKRRGGLILFLLLIIVILLALLWFGTGGFGLMGKNNSANNNTSNSENDANTDFNSDITEIRIEQNDIYLGSEKCVDVNDLKEKITSAGSGKKYKLEHKTAIEDTYNDVRNVLTELRDALDLEIDLNE